MKKRLNITALVDAAEIHSNDPEFLTGSADSSTEFHVIDTLRTLGHNVSVLGVVDDIVEVVNTLTKDKPDMVFNMTEQFNGDRRLDKNIAGMLEMIGIPFTGSGAAALLLCRDKRLCKQLLSLHKIRVPNFISLPYNRNIRIPKNIHYPLVVKPAFEDGSEGISNASVVTNENALLERMEFVHDRWHQAVIAEEYIEGRELYVGVLGNKQLKVLPIRECFFDFDGDYGPNLVTYRVKWSKQYREKWNIDFGFAELSDEVIDNIARICKKVYRVLQLHDYGRIDIRLTADNRVVVLEANPNPDIAYGEEFAEGAEKAGISYEQLIDRILRLAWNRYK